MWCLSILKSHCTIKELHYGPFSIQKGTKNYILFVILEVFLVVYINTRRVMLIKDINISSTGASYCRMFLHLFDLKLPKVSQVTTLLYTTLTLWYISYLVYIFDHNLYDDCKLPIISSGYFHYNYFFHQYV